MPQSLSSLQFDNSFVQELPADPNSSLHSRQVQHACYSRVAPTPVSNPTLVSLAPEVAELLDLRPEELDAAEVARTFSGNQLLPGMEAYASCYGGHQFGNWAGQLGDGRAIGLGGCRGGFEAQAVSKGQWRLWQAAVRSRKLTW